VYRRFVLDFSRLSRPLTQLLKKIDGPNEFAEFDLSSEQLEAFNSLKAAMVNPPVLAIPEVGDELILDTDASKHQLGCVLQLRSGEKSLLPVGYWS
jgi:RNase H-like domain found in reverse transcriptase